MGFLDDVKKGAKDLGNKVSESTDDLQTGRKADQLFHDLGVLTYKAETGQSADTDGAERVRIDAELRALVEAKGALDLKLKTGGAPTSGPAGPAGRRGRAGSTRPAGAAGAARASRPRRLAKPRPLHRRPRPRRRRHLLRRPRRPLSRAASSPSTTSELTGHRDGAVLLGVEQLGHGHVIGVDGGGLGLGQRHGGGTVQ